MTSLAQNSEATKSEPIAQPWVVDAWEMRLRGHISWAKIAEEVGKDPRTVQSHVEKYSQTMARIHDGAEVNPVGEYIDGSFQDLRGQHAIHEEAVATVKVGKGENATIIEVPDYRTRSAALKEVHVIRKNIAAARGVVTERKGVEHSGNEENPVVTKHVIEPAAAAETLAILDRVGARGPDGGDPGGDPETDEVHPAQADPEAGSGPLPEPLP